MVGLEEGPSSNIENDLAKFVVEDVLALELGLLVFPLLLAGHLFSFHTQLASLATIITTTGKIFLEGQFLLLFGVIFTFFFLPSFLLDEQLGMVSWDFGGNWVLPQGS